jgi:hypothetical protein
MAEKAARGRERPCGAGPSASLLFSVRSLDCLGIGSLRATGAAFQHILELVYVALHVTRQLQQMVPPMQCGPSVRNVLDPKELHFGCASEITVAGGGALLRTDGNITRCCTSTVVVRL